MIEFMKVWVVNISIGVFFILAIEMIMPSNSLKKYVKFILGLILMVIIINPIVKLFNGDIDINALIQKNSYVDKNEYKNSYNEYKYKNIENTSQVFQYNLQNKIMDKLKSKYKDNKFDVKAKIKYDELTNSFLIINLDIGVKKDALIKKIEINKKEDIKKEKKYLNDNFSRDIKNYILLEFDIPIKSVNIYLI
ncbi:stage III sporulation protein AF [Haloimpatiens sp. FM7315]|uniref:stage III sporulation protein AF n=1 Tax=Haloimpatiens sp. FM7315 TaxID=3298609 RepID=UPI00370C19C8